MNSKKQAARSCEEKSAEASVPFQQIHTPRNASVPAKASREKNRIEAFGSS